jgi:tRNA (cytosine38-C5)-methyltransferase
MLRVLELFSGIGGMHCALDLIDLNYEIIAAIDINPTANLVYSSNFPNVQVINRSIETISFNQWEKWHADLWLMSPPCQPFTRQGKQEDLNDRRTDGFVYLMKTILSQLKSKPKYILLENVSGFENSQAHQFLLETLQLNNYSYQQYLLSPIQFGIPNSRLRYYLIATQQEHPIDIHASSIQTRISNFERLYLKLREQFPSKHLSIEENSFDRNDQITDQCSHSSEILIDPNQSMFINDFLISNENPDFELDEKQLKRGLQVCDIITCYAKRSFCFTKSYGKYFEGTGSLFRTLSNHIRYFTPKEIANLHCFPINYYFPEQITNRQAYSLLGNSLNVFVIGVLLENLFERT